MPLCFLRPLRAAFLFAFLPSLLSAQTMLPADLIGRYTDDGTCGSFFGLQVTPDYAMVDVEAPDARMLTDWRACPDCLPDLAAGEGERRFVPVLGAANAGLTPVFRFNADGVAGRLVIVRRGALTGEMELDLMIDKGELFECGAAPAKVTQAPVAQPVAGDARWAVREKGARLEAGICPAQGEGIQLCYALACDHGPRRWELRVAGDIAGIALDGAEDIHVDVVVEGEVAARSHFTQSDEPGLLTAPFQMISDDVAVALLAKGRGAELRFTVGSATGAVPMSLAGSSKALMGVSQACYDRLQSATPRSAPGRFLQTQPVEAPAPDLMAALTAHVAQMKAEAGSDIIEIVSPRVLTFDDGWRFAVVDFGPSNYHWGMDGFGSQLFASPPGAPWRQVGPDADETGLVYFDSAMRNQGWPVILFSRGGANAAFYRWVWDNGSYRFDGEIR